MARSDLLINLIKAGNSGDLKALRTTVDAIIAEERAKQHNVLADKLVEALQEPAASAPAHRLRSANANVHSDAIQVINPRKRLDQLILEKEFRILIDDFIEEQMRSSLLRAHGMEPRHRLLLVGAPGTGKTSLAEAIAETLSLPLFYIRYESLIGSFLGETASRLRRVFDFAKTTPCVLFFDEFDSIAKERGDIHETGEIKRVVSSLLLLIDDLPSYCILIGATNHPHLLDTASWRRFQVRMELPLPSLKVVELYIRSFGEIFDESLGSSPATIAKSLMPTDFSELESFCLDVRRQYVLAMGGRPLSRIVNEQLRNRSIYRKVNRQGFEGDRDGESTVT